MTENRQSVQSGTPSFDMVQQPRRFACDRCRMQKLRCERDIWRPSLMPCKRCRKAHMACIITSPVDRAISRRTRQRSGVNRDGPTAMKSDNPLKMSGPTSGTVPSSSSSSFHRELWDTPNTPAHVRSSSRPSPLQVLPESSSNDSDQRNRMLGNEYYPQALDLESNNTTLFSGLITPPSSDAERDQIPYQGAALHSQPQAWTIEEAQGLDHVGYGMSIPPATNVSDGQRAAESDCCSKFLELNLQLLEYQRSISHQLSVSQYPGTALSTANDYGSLTILDSAIQAVLRYSERFIDSIKLSIAHQAFESPARSFSTTESMELPVPPMLAAAHELRQDRPQHMNLLPTSFDHQIMKESTVLSVHPQDSEAGHRKLSRSSEKRDVSTSLALINCYIGLFDIYDVILSRILQDLITCIPMNGHLTTTLSGSFPSFPLKCLGNTRELHLQVLFRVSMHTLAQVEDCLGLPERHRIAFPAQGFEEGVLSNTVAIVLLDTLVSEGYGTCSNGLGNQKRSLKETIQTIIHIFEMV